ncbi:MAG: energy transducer TonB [Candidatus Sulfotelmatobacter sp.]
MLRNMPALRPPCTVVALVLAVGIAPLPLQAASELEQHLRDQYNGKTLLLRNFYGGNSLRYDATGQLSKAATPGDWTVDGVIQVDDVKVSSHHLTIKAKRVHLGWDRNIGFSGVEDPKDKQGDTRSLRIEADLGPGEATAEQADAVLAQIFLTPKDHLVELVPDYWKPCVLAASTGNGRGDYSGCRFSPEFLATPGVSGPDPSQAGQAQAVAELSNHAATRIGKGVAPKPISTPAPSFSEEARRAKYQGVAVLSLFVDKTGQARNVRIVRPLGMGLDQKAVEAVSAWQFRPATKDGEPVDTHINVEVNFHLY